jgi:hypothetical protein
MTSRPPGNQSPNAECTCISQRPGIRYWPLALMTCAFLGGWAWVEADTSLIRLPVTTTVVSGVTEELPGLMTVTCEMTIEAVADWPCAEGIATNEMKK